MDPTVVTLSTTTGRPHRVAVREWSREHRVPFSERGSCRTGIEPTAALRETRERGRYTAVVAHVVGEQPTLFDPSRLVERHLASGATVRVRLEPLADGQVRVLEYRRRGNDEARWQRRPEEEGRTYPLSALGLGLRYDDLFG